MYPDAQLILDNLNKTRAHWQSILPPSPPDEGEGEGAEPMPQPEGEGEGEGAEPGVTGGTPDEGEEGKEEEEEEKSPVRKPASSSASGSNISDFERRLRFAISLTHSSNTIIKAVYMYNTQAK